VTRDVQESGGPGGATAPTRHRATAGRLREGLQNEDAPERVHPLAHRESVVRRLLDLGVSPATLLMLLPDFRPVVDRLARRP
jgi:hypothetical protein